MQETPSPLTIHRPTHWKRGAVVCAECMVRWPCLAATALAAEKAKARAEGDDRVLPWWFIPVARKAGAE